MPLGGLDPSMLLRFLCRDEGDWEDFRRVVGVGFLLLLFVEFLKGVVLIMWWVARAEP
jgi:hypothetical protein